MSIEANAMVATSEKRVSFWRLTVKGIGDKALKIHLLHSGLEINVRVWGKF